MANGCKSMPDKLPFGTLPVKENCMAVWSADLSVRGAVSRPATSHHRFSGVFHALFHTEEDGTWKV